MNDELDQLGLTGDELQQFSPVQGSGRATT